MNKTKIICTIGPASEGPETLRKMILNGMNVARLNFSHGSYKEHLARVTSIKSLRKELKRPIALLLDTKGPEIRIRRFQEGHVELKTGQTFTLTTREVKGTDKIVSVTYEGLPADINPGTRILLDDGLLELKADKADATDIACRVINGGLLSDNKSINLPDVSTNMPYLSEGDKADLQFAYDNDFDFIALSFVRSAYDVIQAKNFLATLGEERCELIAKIENAEGVTNIDEIIRVSHGIMVARGDMGVEIPFEELPGIQKKLIKKCYQAGKKVITATQMLESMIHNPRPTRAEITDIANAIYDGTSAIMLSGETAAGKYPVESLKTMSKIAEKTESSIDYKTHSQSYNTELNNNVTNAISHATCSTAHDLGAAAIVTVTRSGSTARMISRFRPETDIIAITPNSKTYMQLALSWGVTPLLNEYKETSDELFHDAASKTLQAGLAKDGDLIVVTGSSASSTNVTNTLQVHILGNVLAKGIGYGISPVCSRACVISSEALDPNFVAGGIIVLDKTTNDVLRLLSQAKGVITEESFAESGAAAAAIALNIPVISSVPDATRMIKNGIPIILDPQNGFISNGENNS